jgi:prepilin-type N-terminal cleavage/methylation domain-containing protein
MRAIKTTTGRAAGRQGGFTLIELLAVIAVILILAGITVKAVQIVGERARIERAKSELLMFALALEEYKRDHGDYPTNSQCYYQRIILGSCPGSQDSSFDIGLWIPLDERSPMPGKKYVFNWPINRLDWASHDSLIKARYMDPWGRMYFYQRLDKGRFDRTSGGAYELYSVGPQRYTSETSIFMGAGDAMHSLTQDSAME